jgi:hypothetical protein
MNAWRPLVDRRLRVEALIPPFELIKGGYAAFLDEPERCADHIRRAT